MNKKVMLSEKKLQKWKNRKNVDASTTKITVAYFISKGEKLFFF